MVLGDRLRALREENNLTLEQVGQAVGVSHSTIANYESNIRKPRQHILEKLADLFGVSTDYLLGRTSVPNPEGRNYLTGKELLSLLREEIPNYESKDDWIELEKTLKAKNITPAEVLELLETLEKLGLRTKHT